MLKTVLRQSLQNLIQKNLIEKQKQKKADMKQKKADMNVLTAILIGLLAFIFMLAIYWFATGKIPNLLKVFDLF